MRGSEFQRQLRQDSRPYSSRDDEYSRPPDSRQQSRFNPSQDPGFVDEASGDGLPGHSTVFMAKVPREVTSDMIRDFFCDVAQVLAIAFRRKGFARPSSPCQ
jgi:hypothetical protein